MGDFCLRLSAVIHPHTAPAHNVNNGCSKPRLNRYRQIAVVFDRQPLRHGNPFVHVSAILYRLPGLDNVPSASALTFQPLQRRFCRIHTNPAPQAFYANQLCDFMRQVFFEVNDCHLLIPPPLLHHQSDSAQLPQHSFRSRLPISA